MPDQISQIAIPITPEVLIEQIKSSELFEGQYQFQGRSDTIFVAAGGFTIYDVYPDVNYINVIYKHHNLSSDFYDPNLYAQITIDISRFDLAPVGIALNTEKELTLSYYLPVKIKTTYTFTNFTATDANITIYIENVKMQRSLYENWYKVILQYSEDQLNMLVNQAGG